MFSRLMLLLATVTFLASSLDAQTMLAGSPLPWMKQSTSVLEEELVAKYGEPQRVRVQRGLRQMATLWRQEDGDAATFAEFVRTHFAGDQSAIDTMFDRLEGLLEQLGGHMAEIGRVFRAQSDLDVGPVLPFDEILAGYDPAAHVIDDFFKNKLAFAVLLNFPLTTLEERLAGGERWTRRQWAEARLTRIFGKRIPAEVNLAIARATSQAAQYIAEYNIWMHHLTDTNGRRPFPPKLRLLSHWNLRDEIKAHYGEGADGLAKQRLIQTVMERIVTQTIPAVVVNNPGVDWDPITNAVSPSAVYDADPPAMRGGRVNSDPEPDTRYATLLATFRAARKADPYSPSAPSLIARRFDEDREIPEPRVKAMLEHLLSSPLVGKVALLIQQRLGRPLEPFDIWYSGFRPQNRSSELQLDSIVALKYPTADAFKKDIPAMLTALGFSRERSAMLASHIEVDPARGSGHALGAAMRSAPARLRTRVERTGMNYKGFNIAVHEMGHNVEEVISLDLVDHTLLAGVPNTAFTEALAFIFQANDLALLGLKTSDPKAQALKTLNDFWGAYEIAGVALIDMAIWHWMYDNPEATPAKVKEAMLAIARDVWNRYYSPYFGKKDVVLLAVYSHIIDSFLYLPDYPLGHFIAHQIEQRMEKAGAIGSEFERMALAGNIAPDLWMRNATGSPVGEGSLLTAAEHAWTVVAGKDGR